jgi:hypothetical protein
MAGLQPSDNAAPIGGSTAPSNTSVNTGGSAVNGQTSNQTAQTAAATIQATTTTQAATITPILVANVQTTNTIAAQDQFAFANSSHLVGDAILNIATRYSTGDISTNANRAAGGDVMSKRTAYSRLSSAINDYAARSGQTPGQVRTELTNARKAGGVPAAFKGFVKVPAGANNTAGNDQEHTGDTTEDNSDADTQAVSAAVAAPAPAPKVPAVAPVTLPAADQHLFNNSELLHGETILTLAERYNVQEITKHVAKRFGTDATTLSHSGVSVRITRALKIRATANNITLERARDALRQARETNGVTINNKKKTVEPATQAVAATTTPADAAPEGVDTEMVDVSNEDDQRRYTAAELDAADALLFMCQTPPQDREVLDAASILMDLHRDDGSATEEEVSDTEMIGTERAEFMANFQARWRPGT